MNMRSLLLTEFQSIVSANKEQLKSTIQSKITDIENSCTKGPKIMRKEYFVFSRDSNIEHVGGVSGLSSAVSRESGSVHEIEYESEVSFDTKEAAQVKHAEAVAAINLILSNSPIEKLMAHVRKNVFANELVAACDYLSVSLEEAWQQQQQGQTLGDITGRLHEVKKAFQDEFHTFSQLIILNVSPALTTRMSGGAECFYTYPHWYSWLFPTARYFCAFEAMRRLVECNIESHYSDAYCRLQIERGQGAVRLAVERFLMKLVQMRSRLSDFIDQISSDVVDTDPQTLLLCIEQIQRLNERHTHLIALIEAAIER
jgi:hypothetical protein